MPSNTSKGVSAERELKRIFLGAMDLTKKKTLSPEELRGYKLTQEHPFLTVRSAASLQIDIIVCKQDLVLPIEIKASKHSVYHFSGSGLIEKQLRGYVEMSKKYGLSPIYCFRKMGVNGDTWRVFMSPISRELIAPSLRFLYDAVPIIRRNVRGNYQLYWDEGLPLNEFLICLNDHFRPKKQLFDNDILRQISYAIFSRYNNIDEIRISSPVLSKIKPIIKSLFQNNSSIIFLDSDDSDVKISVRYEEKNIEKVIYDPISQNISFLKS